MNWDVYDLINDGCSSSAVLQAYSLGSTHRIYSSTEKLTPNTKYALTKNMMSAFISFVYMHPRGTGDDPPISLLISSRQVYSVSIVTGGAMRRRVTEGEN